MASNVERLPAGGLGGTTVRLGLSQLSLATPSALIHREPQVNNLVSSYI